MTRKPGEHLRKHWTAVSTLLGFLSSVYCDLHLGKSNQRPQIAQPKLYNCANSSYRIRVTSNQLVMVIARPINLNVSCKLYPYSFQRTRSPPGPRLPKRIRNTHPCNYKDLKGKDIDIYFSFLSTGIILWIELPWPEGRFILIPLSLSLSLSLFLSLPLYMCVCVCVLVG